MEMVCWARVIFAIGLGRLLENAALEAEKKEWTVNSSLALMWRLKSRRGQVAAATFFFFQLRAAWHDARFQG
jgi:hypothetical protein